MWKRHLTSLEIVNPESTLFDLLYCIFHPILPLMRASSCAPYQPKAALLNRHPGQRSKLLALSSVMSNSRYLTSALLEDHLKVPTASVGRNPKTDHLR